MKTVMLSLVWLVPLVAQTTQNAVFKSARHLSAKDNPTKRPQDRAGSDLPHRQPSRNDVEDARQMYIAQRYSDCIAHTTGLLNNGDLAKRARTSANYPTEIGQILAAALQIRAECECRKGDSLDEPDRYGQYALAFHDYSEAFDFSHDNGLLLGWASVSEHLGLCDRTGPIADHLLMVGEFVAPAHVLRAYCQARGKLPGSVDESLIKALDALRGERNARFDRGQVGLELGYFFLRQKLPVYAVEALRIAVDLKTQKANGMLCQALVLSDNVNAKNVCTDASRESDPVRAAMALRGQSWLARNEGDLPAALNYNRQAAARDPTPELQLDYSDLLRGVGRTTGADEILSRLIDDQYLPALWRRHDLRCAAGKVVPARDDGIKFVNACARSGECNEKRVLTLCPGPYARKAFQRGVSTPSSN